MIDVVFKSYHPETPNKGYWDTGFLEYLFDGKVWKPAGYSGFKLHDDFATLPKNAKGAIVVIPARYHTSDEDIAAINADISRFEWVLMILSSDEETWFDSTKLSHPNMKLYATTPHPEDHAHIDGLLGEFMRYEAHDLIAVNRDVSMSRPLDWFFAGQITHSRRQLAAQAMRDMLERGDMDGELIETAGFTQGLEGGDYYRKLAGSKVAPAPSGAVTPSSFRVFEALEAGAIPIADNVSPQSGYPKGYWQFLFGGEYFPILENYDQLVGYILDQINDYPHSNNRVYSWWQNYKRDLVYKLQEHVNELSKIVAFKDSLRDKITVLIVTSPIPSHPSTHIIDETIDRIRQKLPDCEILIGIDGVRPEQEDRRADYEEYKQRLLWDCNFNYKNVLPVVFEEHMHQAAMTRELLKKVRTPTILFVEHDTPLTPDFDFPWHSMVNNILSGELNVIRFHFEGVIPQEHKHLMFDEQPIKIGELLLEDEPVKKGQADYIRTRQWSQRPHLASTVFYRDILNTYFSPESRTMIEDVMHGVVDSKCAEDGIMGWYNFRVAIYAPDMNNLKRSYNLDGRENDPKFEMVF